MKPAIVDGDLLDQEVEAIVNPWNRNVLPWWLLLPAGVAGAIRSRAGLAPFRELSRHGPIPHGRAVLTTAGRLPHQAIIHVAVLDLLWRASEDAVRQSVGSAMTLLSEHHLRSVAFPLLGAGVGGLKPDRALEIVRESLAPYPESIEARIVRFLPPA